MRRLASVVVKGGRQPADGDDVGPESRGRDIGIFVRDRNGVDHLIPGVMSMVLRVDGRSSVATLEVVVDEIVVTNVAADLKRSDGFEQSAVTAARDRLLSKEQK